MVVFKELPTFEDADEAKVRQALGGAVKIEPVRAIVMSQACDLANKGVRNATLCPVYDVEQYKGQWEELQRTYGQGTTEKSWKKQIENIRAGRVWNLTLLNSWPHASERAIPLQVVDFHEVFSLPVAFLGAWLRANRKRRLRLLPPYREHLSQSFARFYMRVGLPQEITI